MFSKIHLISFIACVGIIIFLLTLSLSVGAGVYKIQDTFAYFSGDPRLISNEHFMMVMDTLRIPRTVCAVVVGVSLALAASLLQSATRNPLAEPGLLGVNAGAVLGLIIGLTYFNVESTHGYLIWSGVGALVGNAMVLIIGQIVGSARPLKLILVGVALSATFGGIANYILLSNNVVLDQFRFWNLGSLAASDMEAIIIILPFVAVAILLTLLLVHKLTLMQLGEQQAKALGINTHWVRIGVLGASTLFTACAISVAGPISFVGFLAAYCARMVEPIVLLTQVIFSALFGVIFLIAADILARWFIQPFEMPNGVVLSLIGAPVLIFVVYRGGFRSMLSVK